MINNGPHDKAQIHVPAATRSQERAICSRRLPCSTHVKKTSAIIQPKVLTMNVRALLVAATVTACLTGCTTPAQLQQQNDQLLLINTNLLQIQANQLQALALQKTQVSLQIESNNLQALRNAQAQPKGPRHD
ncbi:hypothetical protein PCPL58_p1107 (plasmid) [Pseudomonas cerasi]|nr:hypothetical protein PCPL58_p1107 [Pseudomonas cerasi]SOS30339.1 hypothetical protein PL963_P300061 [Pseudomonas cerasi]